MSLLFIDSFDHLDTATLPNKYDTTPGGWTTINAAAGRNSTKGLRLLSTSVSTTALRKTLPTGDVFIVGIAVNLTSGLPASEKALFVFKDNTTAQVSISISSDGKVRAYRGTIASGTLLGTSSSSINSSGYHYFEAKVTINNTSGTVEVRQDTIALLALSGVNTRQSANNQATLLDLFCNEDGTSTYSFTLLDADDLYICDDAGSVNNDFLGDRRVEAVLPDADGAAANWVPNGATFNFQCVDEVPPDGDTTYVETTITPGDDDTYSFPNLVTTSGTVAGIAINLNARKTDAGTQTLSAIADLSASRTTSAGQTIGVTYSNYQSIQETKPGGGAWTITDVNNSEFGMITV